MKLSRLGCGELIAWTAIAVGIGGLNLGSYDARKCYIINESIRGGVVNLESEGPIYKTRGDKIEDFLGDVMGGYGARLAGERFEAGKFDEIIESHRSEQNQATM